RLDGLTPTASVQAPDLSGLADDLEAAWNAPGVTMRSRQQLLRALVTDIIADIDESTREVILTVHWRGGQHSQLRVRKPKSGEHGCAFGYTIRLPANRVLQDRIGYLLGRPVGWPPLEVRRFYASFSYQAKSL